MKIKEFKFLWLFCPNCESYNIEQREIENERALFCKECHYFMREGFMTFLFIKKDDNLDIQYDKYLPKA